MSDIDPDAIARALHELQYGHMERRTCTAEAPMPLADVDRYRWSHPDAIVLDRLQLANEVVACECPHCGLQFTSFPRPQ